VKERFMTEKEKILTESAKVSVDTSNHELIQKVESLELSLQHTADTFRQYSDTLDKDFDDLEKQFKAGYQDLNLRKAEAHKVQEAFAALKVEVVEDAKKVARASIEASKADRVTFDDKLRKSVTEASELAKLCITLHNKMRDDLKKLKSTVNYLGIACAGFVLIMIMLVVKTLGFM